MDIDKNKNKSKASLTIEAVISFTCYLTFMFLLLSIVKLSMITIVMNGAVSETAKQIATAAYPLSYFIGVLEENDDNVEAFTTPEKFSTSFGKLTATSMLNVLTAEADQKEKVKMSSLEDVASFITRGVSGMILQKICDKGEELINKGGGEFANAIINTYIDESGMPIDKSKLKVRIVKLPVPKDTYESIVIDETYSDFKITKKDFDKNDVIIAVEYEYSINLPFLKGIKLKLRDVAIEQAWMSGCSSMRDFDEGIKLENIIDKLTGKSGKYYATSDGKCYHKKGCMTLWRKNALPLSDPGERPACGFCNPAKAK